VSDAALEFGLDESDRRDLVFAANEAITNAIRHGAPDPEGTIRVEVAADRDRLIVTVSDFGSFLSRAAERDPLAEGGRGFTFMTRLVDEVQLSTGAGRTTVRISQRRDLAANDER
jgi:anti-sigma regulatory factor (Ser/Thr protein kinase)